MTSVVEFPDRSAVAEEAAEWLVRLDGDKPPTQEELQALGEWLHRSRVHREELEHLATLWKRMNVLTELAVPLGNVGRSRSSARRLPLGRFWTTKTGRVGAAAAAIVLAAATILLVRSWLVDSYSATNGLYVTTIGQQKSAALADGSKLLLNTNSQVSVEYSEGFRDIHLVQGEALFTVAKDRARPFRVYAGNRRIEALGTAFSVYLAGADVSVTVTEGHVSLASVVPQPAMTSQARARPPTQGAPVSASDPHDVAVESLGVLRAGQVAIIRGTAAESAPKSGSALVIIEPAALAERLAWRQGALIFSGETLEHVVRELSRYTTVSIEIPDAAVRNMRIGGRFPVGETEAMLASLETNFHLRVTRLDHNRVVLSADDTR